MPAAGREKTHGHSPQSLIVPTSERAGPLTALMQGEPSVLVRLAAIEAALTTRSGLVRFRLATGGGLALILERWLLWAQRCAPQ